MARIQGQLEGIGKRDHAADVRRAAGLRSAGPLPDSRGQSARDVRRRRRSVRRPPDDPGSEHVASRRRSRSDPRTPSRRDATGKAARFAARLEPAGQLAVVPRRSGGRHRRGTELARLVGRSVGPEHCLAHADSRPRTFESRRLGRPAFRHHRDQQPRRCHLQARAVRRRRRLGRPLVASLDGVRPRQVVRQSAVGAAGVRGRATQQAAREVDLCQLDAGNRRPHRRGLVRIARRLCVRGGRLSLVERRSWAPRHRRLRHSNV